MLSKQASRGCNDIEGRHHGGSRSCLMNIQHTLNRPHPSIAAGLCTPHRQASRRSPINRRYHDYEQSQPAALPHNLPSRHRSNCAVHDLRKGLAQSHAWTTDEGIGEVSTASTGLRLRSRWLERMHFPECLEVEAGCSYLMHRFNKGV